MLVGLAIAAASLWAWTAYSQQILEGELHAIEQRCMEEVTQPGLEMRAAVTVSRDWLVAGTARAKVEVFGRSGNSVTPHGFEFYYFKSGDEWVREGSGRCSSEHCVLRAKEVFGQ